VLDALATGPHREMDGYEKEAACEVTEGINDALAVAPARTNEEPTQTGNAN
jgi:hypothetical protein